MKTPIKIKKRDDQKVIHETPSARANTHRTAEVIVKSWIMEARERRRLHCLRESVRQEEMEAGGRW